MYAFCGCIYVDVFALCSRVAGVAASEAEAGPGFWCWCWWEREALCGGCAVLFCFVFFNARGVGRSGCCGVGRTSRRQSCSRHVSVFCFVEHWCQVEAGLSGYSTGRRQGRTRPMVCPPESSPVGRRVVRSFMVILHGGGGPYGSLSRCVASVYHAWCLL